MLACDEYLYYVWLLKISRRCSDDVGAFSLPPNSILQLTSGVRHTETAGFRNGSLRCMLEPIQSSMLQVSKIRIQLSHYLSGTNDGSKELFEQGMLSIEPHGQIQVVYPGNTLDPMAFNY